MTYRYDQILTKKNTTKFAFIGVALVFAMTLMMSSFSSVSAAPAASCSFTTVGSVMTLDDDCFVGSRYTVPAGMTLDGDGHTMYPNFTKTSNSNNATLEIASDNITVRNLTIDGSGGTNLHGINTYLADNVLLDNVTVINNDHIGVVVNGSTVTVNNITTANNGWWGIDVDLGSGVTTPAVLTITGHSTQTDLGQIYVDDTTKAVTVNDTLPQYTFVHLGLNPNDRLYMLDTTAPTTPTMQGFLSPTLPCGVVTNIHSTTVDWSDSTDAGGVGVMGYNYQIDYPKPGGTRGIWNTFKTTSQHTGALNEGIHHIRVQAVDYAGNASTWSDWCNITADWTAPVVDVTSHSNGDYVHGTVNVEGTITDDNNDHYWFVIYDSSSHNIAGPGVVNDTNSIINASFSWDTTAVPDGDYIIKLEARDQAGNKDANSVEWVNVTVDNTAPAKPTNLRRLLASDHSVIYPCGAVSQIQSFHPDWADNTDTDFDHYEYTSFNAGGAIGIDERVFYDSIFEYNGSWLPGEGTYGFAVRAVDQAGNKSDWALTSKTLAGSCQITYDSTAPDMPVHILPPAGSHVTAGTVDFDWTDVIDPAVPVTYIFQYSSAYDTNMAGELTFPTYTSGPLSASQISVATLPAGTYYWQVRAVDGVGNEGHWTSPWQIIVDEPQGAVLGATDTRDNGTTDKKVLGESTLSETGNSILSSVLLGTLLIVLPLILVATTNYSVESGSIKKQ